MDNEDYVMPILRDGPVSELFMPVAIKGNMTLEGLRQAGVSERMVENIKFAPTGSCVGWGIPFETDHLVLVKDEPVTIDLGGVTAPSLIISHVADLSPVNQNITETRLRGGPAPAPMYEPQPIEHTADYVFVYADGTEVRSKIERRRHIGAFATRWAENCLEASSHMKPAPSRSGQGDKLRNAGAGYIQARNASPDMIRAWLNWLWTWRNPQPGKALAGLRIEPVKGPLVIFAITRGKASGIPTVWRTRRKAVLTLPEGEKFDPSLVHHGTVGWLMEEMVGGYRHLKMDMGQIISMQPRPIYPNGNWPRTENNEIPRLSIREVLVEYVSHPDARFHLPSGATIAVRDLETESRSGALRVVPPAERRVRFRAVDKKTGRPLAVKLHIHGTAGEYLPPMNTHRLPNPNFFADYAVDYVHRNTHVCNYIDGEAEILLPQGQVYVEVSKGFEVKPVRKAVDVAADTGEIVIELDNVLDWRSKGWVTADTHVHFLSPQSALLEGAAEGVNVVNLLASQWGELFTNMGDFDGKTTYGSREAGGGGEYLVRVGTENRQAPLGHISLLGYENEMILPLCSDGPLEAALGDPVNALVTEWAARCKAQNGTVVLPHFRDGDRVEGAAAIVSGNVDAVELTSLREQAVGSLNPYSLAYWYGFLNCGYFVAAVGGTDKMAASTAVGTARTYAKLADDEPFDYQAWQRAVERGRTFVTLGPLVEMTVDGMVPGGRIEMPASGGTVHVVWSVESVTTPMLRAELIVNGEVRESKSINAARDSGQWRLKVDKSAWAAVLIRGNDPMHGEVISAHTSPVILPVEGSEFMAAADALTILSHIEGSIAYLDSVAPRADEATYKKFRLILSAAHRQLHNRLHRMGVHHGHNAVTDHREHH